MSLRPIDIAPFHEGKLRPHASSCELDDFLICFYLLVEELRAGKCNNLHAVLFVLLVHIYELDIALVCEGSLARDIDDNRQLVAIHEIAENHRLSFYTR